MKMTPESYCAQTIKFIEGEVFLSVGDEQVDRFLNPHYLLDKKLGTTMGLPDLLSTSKTKTQVSFRLREVKFKLEQRLVMKALKQLNTGIRQLNLLFGSPIIDRVEIVVPLRGRNLKKDEFKFLGEPISPIRFFLNWKAGLESLEKDFFAYPVTVLMLS